MPWFVDPQTVVDTIVRPVHKLTEVEPTEIEVWHYVEKIPAKDLRGYSIEGSDVECVFRGNDGHYDHVLIPTTTPNTYLIVIVDRKENEVLGHHVLNRNDLYDLPKPRY